ncbi:uncharacterized protein YndB with AHSA1/START domain [Paenibacillus phyllosphaerae]|uniref:Uncharacterized protein YndB with AHSA1/START domain n=1 Tax=Paenibacillus phyllosphaerae TaxID=274593 RepID=A0A7W5FPQ3_9BACL|nr:SRPBCC family protein [Paenibacillus phyllosphaerae]MBB3112630.1 uncharacterized protein YndB with AHSA1/START domain [Paenibacillus phyllosphaerae]
MNNVTAMSINKPAHDIFEAFVDPVQIGGFWFSSSSQRWEQGAIVTIRYEEYGAEGQIEVQQIVPDRKIVFTWGDGHTVTIDLRESGAATVVEVTEEGFKEDDPDLLAQLIDNKEGWVYALTCLKGYLEYGAVLRASLVKG